jgi:Glycosyltransferase family 87
MQQPRFRAVARLTAVIALILWAVWWTVALIELDLPLGRLLQFPPCFGCDFWPQTDLAARIWSAKGDPYANEQHLFHYPPIVIRLFAWTPLLSTAAALRIWVVALVLVVIAGTVVACKTRRELRLEELPVPVAVAGLLFSFPVLFTLERGNFDLIALAAILLALPLDRRGGWAAEIAAGCLLAVAPWVKIYPGLIGIGLLALRRYRVFAGFVGAGVAIGLATPRETLRSFEVLRMAIDQVRQTQAQAPAWPFNHSLSLAWMHIGEAATRNGLPAVARVPGPVVAAALLAPALAWVCYRIYRCEQRRRLTYPLLLWVVALGSYVPDIANDYSLVILPLAVVATYRRRESRLVHAAMVLLLISMQPIALPIHPYLLLLCKLAGVLAVGAMLVERAEDIGSGAAETATDADRKASARQTAAQDDGGVRMGIPLPREGAADRILSPG